MRLIVRGAAVVAAALLAASVAQATPASAGHGCRAATKAPRDVATGQSSGRRQHRTLSVAHPAGGNGTSSCSDQAGGQAHVVGLPLKGVDVKLGK